jgi:N-acetylmuramoyl-L-alanine amidase
MSRAILIALVLFSSPAFAGEDEDVRLVADVVCREARGDTFIGRMAVAYVVKNRVRDRRFPSTIRGVIYQPWAFAPMMTGQGANECYRSGVLWKGSYRAAQVAMTDDDQNHGAKFFDSCKTAPEFMRRLGVVFRTQYHCFYGD